MYHKHSILGLMIGLSALAGAATAAPTISNLNVEFVENALFIPFWVTIALCFAAMSMFILSTFAADYFAKVTLTLFGILCALCSAGSTFLTGDIISTTESAVTVILYQSAPLLWFTAGLALIGIMFLVMYVIGYSGEVMINE